MMYSKKQAILLLQSIVIAMSIVGLAYSSWTEQIAVNSTVNTATLNLTFYFVGEPTEYDPLNAATATVNPKGELTGDIDVLTLTVTNAYPTYKVTMFFRIKNIGTIPAKFKGFFLNGEQASYSQTIGGWAASLPGGEITFQGYDGEGEILGTNAIRTFSVTIEVTENAQPNTTYNLVIGLMFEQSV